MQNYRGMAVYAAVVEAGSFTGAAKRLGLAKSAVSRTVSELEQELGLVLLHRTTRRLTPSEAGLSYYDGCARMIAAAESADGTVRDVHSEPSGTLRLSAPEVLGEEFVVPAVAQFAKAYPRLQVEINLEDRYVRIVEEGLDLAIRAGVLEDSALVARMLTPVASVVCGSTEYFARRGVPRTPADLARHDWIQYTPFSTRVGFSKNGRRKTVTLKGRLRTNNGSAAIKLVHEGYGLTLAPLWIIHRALEAGHLKVALGDYETRRTAVYAIYPEGRHLLPKVRLFVNYLGDLISEVDWRNVRPQWIAG